MGAQLDTQTDGGEDPMWPLRVPEDAVRLAARLRVACTTPEKVILFTGAATGDGVSTIVSRIGIALAQMEQGPVLLVEANVRAPSLHVTFEVTPVPGLSDVIAKKASVDEAIHATEVPGLFVLPVGEAVADPVALLTPAGYSGVMRTLRGKFPLVLVDSPPILESVEATLIAPHVDGVVIVIAAGKRRRAEVREIKRVLDGLRIQIIGVVLSSRSSRRRAGG